MKKKLRMITSWILVSLMLQFTFYYFLNKQVEKVMAPVSNGPVVVKNLEAEIPGTNLENIQISYAKEYVAYKEDGVLKVFNLRQNKVVFEKKPQEGSDKNMGVLYYQWLPDRDTLVYFYARKNPNPYTTVVVPVTPAQGSTSTQGTSGTSSQKPSTTTNPANSNTTSPSTSQPTTPKSGGVKAQSTETLKALSNPSVAVTNPPAKTQEPEKLEDPNQGANNPSTQKPEVTNPQPAQPQTRIEKRPNNPQITELFTLELPPGDEEGTKPDDRYNRSIDFPAGGEITQMVVSTFTNLIYLTVKNGSNYQLMEIDIMKNVRNLNRSGEILSQMAASDKFGTLYVKSKVGKTEQILALRGWDREVISQDPEDVILGNRSGTIYLGKVEGDRLINIRSASDTSDNKNLEFKTIWKGSIPYKNSKGVIIGAKNEVIIYDNQTAYVIKDGKEKEISLPGEENIISLDGVELIELTHTGTSTKVKLQPLGK